MCSHLEQFGISFHLKLQNKTSGFIMGETIKKFYFDMVPIPYFAAPLFFKTEHGIFVKFEQRVF